MRDITLQAEAVLLTMKAGPDFMSFGVRSSGLEAAQNRTLVSQVLKYASFCTGADQFELQMKAHERHVPPNILTVIGVDYCLKAASQDDGGGPVVQSEYLKEMVSKAEVLAGDLVADPELVAAIAALAEQQNLAMTHGISGEPT